MRLRSLPCVSRLLEPVCLALLLLAISSSPAMAGSGLLSSTLGRWLDTEVVPELGRMLGQHPRFKGETIHLVSLQAGKPLNQSSRLHQAVKAHLTQRLLAGSGVRIAWTDQAQTACGVREPAVYLLGVEIDRDDARNYKLNIGMIDVQESVWVSGVNFTWRGRLTATETAALSQQVAAAPEGTLDNPLPVAASQRIAQTMYQHLRCALPEGLNGPVFLATAEPSEPNQVFLNRVRAQLQSELATAPIAAVTRNPEDADWVLSVSTDTAGSRTQTRQLALLLEDRSNEVTQQVATVYVRGLRANGNPAGSHSDTLVAANEALLSTLRLGTAQAEGVCDRRAQNSHCAEISFDLLRPAYLFVFSTQNRQLHSISCDSRLVEASAGERRFRIRVAPSAGNQPDAGIYAIAVDDRSAAKELSRHIKSVCTRPSGGTASWLADLDQLISLHPVDWRAIHLAHTPQGIERL
jgi:hypothetical protein